MRTPVAKKKGRVAHEWIDTHVLIEPHLLEWGKQQDGGFGAMVRKLVKREYEREQQRSAPSSSPPSRPQE